MHRKIPFVDAAEFSHEVEMWCVRREIQTHYQNDVTYVENDGNPFWQFLLEHGDVSPDDKGCWVAIAAT